MKRPSNVVSSETPGQLRDVPPTTARLARDIVAARQKARNRYPDSDRLFFTTETLAQATAPTIAAYHAAVLAPLGTVADLGCGVGMDTIALAEAGAEVIAVERDPVRCLFAEANAVVRGVADRILFQNEDVETWSGEADAIFADPARRATDGTRFSRNADAYTPSLDSLHQRIQTARGGGLKLSPLLSDRELDALGGRIEFLSERRECKEAALWFGETSNLSRQNPRAAVLLPERLVFSTAEGIAPVRTVGAFVFDPDPALIRADALPTVCERYGIALISPHDVYLTGDSVLPENRVASAYVVTAAMPFQRKEAMAFLRAKHREWGDGTTVLKKNRARMELSALEKELKLGGRDPDPNITLILVRESQGHSLIFCRPISEN